MSKLHQVTKVFKYGLLIVVGVFFITLLLLVNKLGSSKNYYLEMTSGKTSVDLAINSIKNHKYSQAEQQAKTATINFNEALNSLEEIRENKVAAYFMPISASIDDLEYLTKTAEILSKSLQRSTAILAKMEVLTDGRFNSTFSDLSDSDRQQILELIHQSAPELNGLRANLLLSLDNLNKIHKIGVLLPVKSQLNEIKEQLSTATNLLEQLIPLTQLLPSLAGYPQESNFLVLLQNNDELRPTGGFIGTYGLMTVKNGHPGNIITEDVYHLDMPCVDILTVTPPDPIKNYMGVKYWWLRDANFSPDFPSSAKQVENMFLAESKCANKLLVKPTAIIAINPGLITDLLDLVGEITVEETTYNASNFQPLLQYNVEVAYVDKNIKSWDRKEIINAVVAKLKDRLLALPTNKLPEVLNILQKNIANRNLQIWFADDNQQKIAGTLNITGEIKNSNSDYLMVVDANLAAFKSDAVMKKNISYHIEGETTLKANLKLNYSHEGGYDWRTTKYRSYTRIYAPLGSKLINHSEVLSDFSSSDDLQLNKTVFGFFWTISPGTNQEIYLNYSLPDYINTNNYSLYFQKQSGSRLNNLSITNPLNAINWSGTLDRDRIFK